MSNRQSLRVAELDAGQTAAWDAFVRARPEGTFFQLSGWKPVLESAFGHRVHLLAAWRGRTLCGVLPLVELRNRVFDCALISTAFGTYGGPLADDAATRARLDVAAQELGARLGVAHLEYRLRERLHPDWPCREDRHATFRKAIDPDPDVNLKAIPRKQRAVVRKARESDLRVGTDESLTDFYRLYALSLRNLGTPVFARRYLTALKAEFGDACEVTIVRTPEGRAISGVLSFYFRDEVLPYYGGGTPDARRNGANDLMYWDVMCRAAGAGGRVFDFGRSKVGSGAYAFKKNWGFTPASLYHEYALVRGTALPDKSPDNPKYRAAIRAWQRLPLWAANTLGPPVARELG